MFVKILELFQPAWPVSRRLKVVALFSHPKTTDSW